MDSETLSMPQLLEAPLPGVFCSECGRKFSVHDVVVLMGFTICPNCHPWFLQRLRENIIVSRSTAHFARFWIRFAAQFIDGLILGGVNMALNMIFLPIMAAISISANPTESFRLILLAQAVYFITSMAIGMAYDTICVGRWGGTPGKLILHLRIVTADGGKVSYKRALGRHFAKMLSGVVFVGYLMAIFDEEARTLHDRICDTRVIKRTRPESSRSPNTTIRLNLQQPSMSPSPPPLPSANRPEASS